MMGSVMNYLNDDIERNIERLEMLKNYIDENPLKSIQEKKRDNSIYLYIVFRKDTNIKQEYLGSKKKISLMNELKKLNVYNEKVKRIKEKFMKLKEENRKLLQIRKYIKKVYYA